MRKHATYDTSRNHLTGKKDGLSVSCLEKTRISLRANELFPRNNPE